MSIEMNDLRYKHLAESSNRSVSAYFNQETTTEIFLRTVVPIGGCVVGGAIAGGTLLAFGGPPGIVGGAIGGAIIGAGVGCAISCVLNYPNYSKWLESVKLKEETDTFIEFERYHLLHQALQEFLDPITQKIMLDPVRIPSGRFVDRSTLENRCNLTGEIIIDGMTFNMNQINKAPEMIARMKAVFMRLLQEEASTLSPMIKEGMVALVSDLEKQVKAYISNETMSLIRKMNFGEITLDVYLQNTEELNQRMNPKI
jgi:hypothetical protein